MVKGDRQMTGKTACRKMGRHTEIPQEQEMGEKEAGGEEEEGGWKGREQEQGQTRQSRNREKKRGKTHQADEESPQDNRALHTVPRACRHAASTADE